MSIGMPSTNTNGSLLVSNEEIPRILIVAASAPGKPDPCVTFKPVMPPCKDWEREVIGFEDMFLETSKEEIEEIEFNFFSSEIPVTTISSNSSASELKETVKLLIARDTTYS